MSNCVCLITLIICSDAYMCDCRAWRFNLCVCFCTVSLDLCVVWLSAFVKIRKWPTVIHRFFLWSPVLSLSGSLVSDSNMSDESIGFELVDQCR